jgi:hypothetical protein
MTDTPSPWFIASSYDGLLLLLQFPFACLSAVIAMFLAFSHQTRSLSICFATLAILFTLAGGILEVKANGFQAFDFLHSMGMLFILSVPPLLALTVLIFGKKPNHRPPQ